jgi:hypothetical protein
MNRKKACRKIAARFWGQKTYSEGLSGKVKNVEGPRVTDQSDRSSTKRNGSGKEDKSDKNMSYVSARASMISGLQYKLQPRSTSDISCAVWIFKQKFKRFSPNTIPVLSVHRERYETNTSDLNPWLYMTGADGLNDAYSEQWCWDNVDQDQLNDWNNFQ